MIKKIVYILFIFSAGMFPIFSDVKEDFDKVVDFSVTLETINRAVSADRTDALPLDKLIVIDGAISSIEIIDGEPDSFIAELEIVDGRWIGFEDVRMFSCIVTVTGNEFAARIPARRSRTEIRNEITAKSHVIVAGKISDFRDIPGKDTVTVLEGYYIRTID